MEDRSKCQKIYWREFHYSNFCLCHGRQKAFTVSPLLPDRWYFQWIYVAFRWVVAFFFLACLLVDLLGGTTWKYLIYLTNWGYLLLTLYLLWSACTATYGFVCSVYHRKSQEQPLWIRRPSQTGSFMPPLGRCGLRSNRLAWYQVIQWLLFTVALEVAVSIVVLYWIVYSPLNMGQDVDNSTESSGDGDSSSALGPYTNNSNDTLGIDYYTLGNLVPHLVNGIVAMTDFWVCGIPVRLYHFIYPMLTAAVYCSFTIVYFAVGGTDNDGNNYIYYVLDYEGNRPLADEVILLTLFVMIPAIHLVFYVMFIMRSAVHHLLGRHCYRRWSRNIGESLFVELDEPNSDNSDNDDSLEGNTVDVSNQPRLIFAETY